MTSHNFHPPVKTHGLADDCPRCAEHARHPGWSLDEECLGALQERVALDLPPRSLTEAAAMAVMKAED